MLVAITCETCGRQLARLQMTDPEDMTTTDYTVPVANIPPCPYCNQAAEGGIAEYWLAKKLFEVAGNPPDLFDKALDLRNNYLRFARIVIRIVRYLGDPAKLPTTAAQADAMWNGLNKS